MTYSLQEIATGGIAATGTSLALTQYAKKLIELKVPPTDPRHDTLVELAGLLISIGVVLYAALATTMAAPFSSAWWAAAGAAVLAGIGIKFGASGIYRYLTTGKVDGNLLEQVGQVATMVEQMVQQGPNSGPTAAPAASMAPSALILPSASPAPTGEPAAAPAPESSGG